MKALFTRLTRAGYTVTLYPTNAEPRVVTGGYPGRTYARGDQPDPAVLAAQAAELLELAEGVTEVVVVDDTLARESLEDRLAALRDAYKALDRVLSTLDPSDPPCRWESLYAAQATLRELYEEWGDEALPGTEPAGGGLSYARNAGTCVGGEGM